MGAGAVGETLSGLGGTTDEFALTRDGNRFEDFWSWANTVVFTIGAATLTRSLTNFFDSELKRIDIHLFVYSNIPQY